MCYDITFFTHKNLKYAKRFGADEKRISELERELRRLGQKIGPTYHATGFDHPDVPVITNEQPDKIQLFNWGLIPYWVKDVKQGVQLSNKTLNARVEEMFEKRSFKEAATRRRCLVIVDGFFEYHWKNDKSYPYHIRSADDQPIALGGLWETWALKSEGLIRNTFAIVTTKANPLMARIHNRPKGSIEPRMPMIVPREMEEEWLQPIEDSIDIKRVLSLAEPYPESDLKAYTVNRLRGKQAVGNVPEAVVEQKYAELEAQQGELF